MRRWLRRLLKPARQEARVFRAQPALPPIIDVLSETADAVTDAIREGNRERTRQHRLALEKKGPASPLPFAELPTTVKASANSAAAQNQEVDPRFRALSRAVSPDERRRIAARLPELRPPHRCLTDRENLVLEWTYWDGLSDADIEQKLGGASAPHIVRNEALRKLAKHVAAQRQPVQEAPRQLPEPYTPRKLDPRIAALQLASTAKLRQEAAKKHPTLRPPHDALSSTQDLVLELAFWQGLTYKEVGKQLGVSSSRASQISHIAVRKLNYRLARGGQLGVAPDLDTDRRLDDFRAAHAVMARSAVAARYPELKLPHTFLQNRENDVLERFYWQGQTFDSIARLYSLTRHEVTKIRNDALRKLNFHYQRTQAQAKEQQAGEAEAAHTDVPAQLAPSFLGEDTRVAALRHLGPPSNRRKVAGRYPELRPPHECLSQDENDLLELALRQGRPYAEIASRKGIAGKEVGKGVRGALARLNAHLCRDHHDDEDHLDKVLLALNECSSLQRAAKKLEVRKDVLEAFIERAGIKSHIVFEVEA